MLKAGLALAALVAAQGWTAEQDHRAMLDRLGIAELRRGPSGDPKAPNAANVDPALANPHPDWPALMTMRDGRRVTSAAMWRRERRPEIATLFEREVVGRIPAGIPAVAWSAAAPTRLTLAGAAATSQRLSGQVGSVTIDAALILPEARRGRVPVLVMLAPPRWVSWDSDPRVATIVAAGWGAVLLDPASVQADNGAGLRSGIVGLATGGRARAPDEWGALRAWGWGASRVLDYLLTRRKVDPKAIGVEGVSRYGKAALVAAAFDERFAMALIGSAGEGGTSPYRRNFGEALENLAGAGQHHWMAGNFLKYAAEAGPAGRRTAADLPVDAHMLIALVAPRLAFISYGVPERGDALWLDQQGSYMATIAAGQAWTLLGARDLGRGHDYRTAVMPPVNTPLLDGRLAWRQHDGGHTDAPNIAHFIAWADRQLGRPGK